MNQRRPQAADVRPDVTWAFPEDANDVLKHEPRPREELTQTLALPGYKGPGAERDPSAVTDILSWISEHI